MARLAFGVAGAVIGSYVGQPSLGWTIGSMIGGALFPEQLPDVQQQGQRLNDLTVQSSAYGQMVPWVRGTIRLGGNIIWAKPLREVITTTSEEQGGKGGPSQTVTTTTYQYYATFAIAFCAGEIAGIRKMWMNGELVYDVDASGAGAGTIMLSAEKWTSEALREYVGSETQVVDSAIEDHEGAGNSSAYRGTAYLVIEDLDVTANRIVPIVEAEVVHSGARGPLLTYYDIGLTAGAGSTQNDVVYLPSRGEIWVRDVYQNYPWSDSSPGGYAVFNVLTGASELVSLPAQYYYPDFYGTDWKIHAYDEYDKILVTAREMPLGYYRSQLVYQISTRQFIASWRSTGLESEDFTGYGIDVERQIIIAGTALIKRIYSMNIDTFLPVALLYSINTEPLGMNQGQWHIKDRDGGLWTYDNRQGASLANWVRWRPVPDEPPYLNWTYDKVSMGTDGYQSGETDNPETAAYDSVRHRIYYLANASQTSPKLGLKTLDIDTLTVSDFWPDVDNTETAPWGQLIYDAVTDRLLILNGCNAAENSFAFYVVNCDTATIEESYTEAPGVDTYFNSLNAYYARTVWGYGSGADNGPRLQRYVFDALNANAPTLSSVRQDLNAEVGVTAAQLDSSGLAGVTVRGYAVARLGTARAAEEALMMRYNYDVVESGGTLKAVRRGGATARAFTADDLGVS